MVIKNGWRPVTEYRRNEYDWVLVKMFDGDYECVPIVAEMRGDGKWYDHSGIELPFKVKYFFDMQQLDENHKVYISTKSTPFEGMPLEVVRQISDDLHEAAKMFKQPYCDEVIKNGTEINH